MAVVGYTNAGKSTLFNAVTQSDVLTEDKLFATLDVTTRRMRFPKDRELVITDTVGFIRDLPDGLVNAFKATLEEAVDADLLVHVVDITDPQMGRRRSVDVLDTELDDKPRIMVFNKVDLSDPVLPKPVSPLWRLLFQPDRPEAVLRAIEPDCGRVVRLRRSRVTNERLR